jgi:hypothetical protein
MKQSSDEGLLIKMPHYCWIVAVVILLCLQGCSSTDSVDDVVVASTPAEKAQQLRERLLVLQAKLNEQKTALKNVINNEADLELLLRLMNVKQQDLIAASKQNEASDNERQPTADTPSTELAAQQLNVDYLQTMAANQAALRADLAKLIQDLNALSANSQ